MRLLQNRLVRTDSAPNAAPDSRSDSSRSLAAGLVASAGLTLAAIGVALYLMKGPETGPWQMSVIGPVIIGITLNIISFLAKLPLRLVSSAGFVKMLAKLALTLPAFFALAFGNLPIWADAILSAYLVVSLVASAILSIVKMGMFPIDESVISFCGLTVMAWSVVGYVLKSAFGWFGDVALVAIMLIFIFGFAASLLALRIAPGAPVPRRLGWAGIIVAVVGAPLALSGITVAKVLALVPL